MRTLGIIGASEAEVAALVNDMDGETAEIAAGAVFHCGTLNGQAAVVAQCGVGKVCAALCAQLLIDRFGVDALINTGVAGGLAGGMSIGDLVVADAAVQHDFDISAFGHARGYMPVRGGDSRLPSFYDTDPALTAALREAVKAARWEKDEVFACHGGVVATGDVFVSTTERKQALRREFDAVAADMEGAAIAQAASVNGVPFALVRAISDLADGSAAASFDAFERESAARSARILLALTAQMAGRETHNR